MTETAPLGPPPGERDAFADIEDKPSGPAAATLLAAGFGIIVLGLLTSLAEADEGAADALTFDKSVGALSGKTVVTMCVFLVRLGRARRPPATQEPAAQARCGGGARDAPARLHGHVPRVLRTLRRLIGKWISCRRRSTL